MIRSIHTVYWFGCIATLYAASNLTFVGLTQTIFNHAYLVYIYILLARFKFEFIVAFFLSFSKFIWWTCVMCQHQFLFFKHINQIESDTFQWVLIHLVDVHLRYRKKCRTLFHYKHMRIKNTQHTLPVELLSQLLPVRALLPFFFAKRNVHTI